ncbi:MAG TPA: ABC transporter ATP-binding protein [Aggregatilinea sp.]|uniref:ABC transporter ATP-binding protein n=1 Tax=Aggregatilinea sp. TaxID=2806333 RepID=UPI002CEAEA2F|nr:ABC transporter ATP-binding protein [Aggregatilinea sp.]HML20838.1 ABC transporter ATP-binding protein [Aggregatilinea sp.]
MTVGAGTAEEFIIETDNLVKTYGKLTAVNGVSLRVPRGAIYGFVGPNGAGKTTTMRILTTLITPTSGTATVAGYSVTQNPREVRRAIGYMPDFFGVYDDMKVWEYLDFFAACYEIPERERPALVNDLLALVDLSHRRDDMVEKLSRGMKQRLSLARTLAHDPEVLILDEPASGLDPRARIEIRELLVEMARMGKTIFFSSHILADVAEICTHLGIIESGQMVAQGTVSEIRQQLLPTREIIITLLNRTEEAKETLMKVEGVTGVTDLPTEQGRGRIRVDFSGSDEAVSQLLLALSSQSIPVVSFSEETRDLESVFMRATKGIVS